MNKETGDISQNELRRISLFQEGQKGWDTLPDHIRTWLRQHPAELLRVVEMSWAKLTPTRKQELFKRSAEFFIQLGDGWSKMEDEDKRTWLDRYAEKHTGQIEGWHTLLRENLLGKNNLTLPRPPGEPPSLTGSPQHSKFLITK